MSRQDEIKRQLTRYNRRLQILKEKEAAYGLETPVSILTEIPDIEGEIEALQAELAQIQQTFVQPSAESPGVVTSRRRPSLIQIIAGVSILVVIALVVGVFILIPPPMPDLFEDFSVIHPENEETLPLDESQTAILEGVIPRELGQTAEIDVEVYKLPERCSIPQSGRLRLSTVRGVWSYMPVTFAGEGMYEIVVSIAVAGDQDFRSIKVACLEKAEVYRTAIEHDRQERGVASLVLATAEEVSLDQVKKDLYQLQKQFFDFYPQDLEGAQAIIYQTLDILDPVLPLFPDDTYLQNVRAYTFKNYALVMRNSNNLEEFDRALEEAKNMFEALRQQNPKDAGAWNGLGSVALLRNNPDKALYYIDTALELEPNYPEAIRDRETVLKMLGDQ